MKRIWWIWDADRDNETGRAGRRFKSGFQVVSFASAPGFDIK